MGAEMCALQLCRAPGLTPPASVGPSLEAFPLTRKEPADCGLGRGSPLPLLLFPALMIGKKAAFAPGKVDEDWKMGGV